MNYKLKLATIKLDLFLFLLGFAQSIYKEMVGEAPDDANVQIVAAPRDLKQVHVIVRSVLVIKNVKAYFFFHIHRCVTLNSMNVVNWS